jgi:hypothetical protein
MTYDPTEHPTSLRNLSLEISTCNDISIASTSPDRRGTYRELDREEREAIAEALEMLHQQKATPEKSPPTVWVWLWIWIAVVLAAACFIAAAAIWKAKAEQPPAPRLWDMTMELYAEAGGKYTMHDTVKALAVPGDHCATMSRLAHFGTYGITLMRCNPAGEK